MVGLPKAKNPGEPGQPTHPTPGSWSASCVYDEPTCWNVKLVNASSVEENGQLYVTLAEAWNSGEVGRRLPSRMPAIGAPAEFTCVCVISACTQVAEKPRSQFELGRRNSSTSAPTDSACALSTMRDEHEPASAITCRSSMSEKNTAPFNVMRPSHSCVFAPSSKFVTFSSLKSGWPLKVARSPVSGSHSETFSGSLMPPRRKPRATCAVSSTSSLGSYARIARGEKPSELVEPGWSV